MLICTEIIINQESIEFTPTSKNIVNTDQRLRRIKYAHDSE